MHRKSPQIANYYGDGDLLRRSIYFLVWRGPLRFSGALVETDFPEAAKLIGEFNAVVTGLVNFLRGRELD